MNLHRVGRRYRGGPWVLRDVELALPPGGALVRVRGTNGSGKSTLLRLLAGVDAPTTGRITDRPRRTAYVPERFPATLPLTVDDYLVHLGRVHGLRGPVAAARAARWLERFGAGGHARTPLPELSKGGGQKVAVAQALLAEPDLLVLDEAWTGLDAVAREELDRAVGERVAAGAAVVFVDHDPRRLAGAAEAVFVVEDGRVRAALGAAAGAGAGVGVGADPGPGPGPGPGPSLGSGSGPGGRPLLVRVVASGGRLPGRLPGAPAHAPLPDGGVAFTVPAGHSDALLRALLTAHPPWRIHQVCDASGTERGP
ncbi:ATP-binding cassette domain-containing protein [Streptomyces sp. NPDC050856]|uniref:ATP-binding cassette domain-containing protein n=1 Tax=Streptomyces sp. NPDC050856 TaxID=3154939 RepID=UPI00340E179E